MDARKADKTHPNRTQSEEDPEMSFEENPAGVTPAERLSLFGVAVVLAILCSILFQGSRGLYESTEGRYVKCARETLDSGQLLEPMLNGAHHWTKPPLTYAAIAAGLACFGDNGWGARAYLAVAFVLTVFSVYWAGRSLWDKQAAGLAALIYATSPFTVGAANAISTDTLLVCFQAMATACFWIAMTRNRKAYMAGMWVALGFAALAKGPAGFVPLAGIVPAYIVLRRGKDPVPPLFPIAGIASFAVIGMGWYVLEIARHPFLLRYWVMDEVVGRFAENEFQRNPEFSKMFTIYPPVLLFGTGPWLVLLALKWKHLGISRQAFAQWRKGPYQAHWWYFACGILLPFIFFGEHVAAVALYPASVRSNRSADGKGTRLPLGNAPNNLKGSGGCRVRFRVALGCRQRRFRRIPLAQKHGTACRADPAHGGSASRTCLGAFL